VPIPYIDVTDADVETNIASIRVTEENEDIEVNKENGDRITFNYTGGKVEEVQVKKLDLTMEAWNTERPGIRKEKTREITIEVLNETMPEWGFFVPIPVQRYEDEGMGTPNCAVRFCNLDQLLEYSVDIADTLLITDEDPSPSREAVGNLMKTEPRDQDIMDTFNQMGTRNQDTSKHNTDRWLTHTDVIDVGWSEAEEEIEKIGEDNIAIHIPEGGLPGPGPNNMEITKEQLETDDKNITYYTLEYEPQQDEPDDYNSPWYYRMHTPVQKTTDEAIKEETRTPLYVDETIDEENKTKIQDTLKDTTRKMWNEELQPYEMFEEGGEIEFEAYKHGVRVGICKRGTTGEQNCDKLRERTGSTETPAIFRDSETGKLNIMAGDKENLTKIMNRFEEAFGEGNPWALRVKVPVPIELDEEGEITIQPKRGADPVESGYLTLPPRNMTYYVWDEMGEGKEWLEGTRGESIKRIMEDTTEERMDITDLNMERSDNPNEPDVFWIIMRCNNDNLEQCGEDIEPGSRSQVIDRFHRVFGTGSGGEMEIRIPEQGVFFTPLATAERRRIDIGGMLGEGVDIPLAVGGPNIALMPRDQGLERVEELLQEYQKLVRQGKLLPEYNNN